MPNWCENELTVQGESAIVNAFLEAMRGEATEIDFDKIIPQPEVIKGGGEGWYDWRNTHWGTKWNACDSLTMSDQSADTKRKVTIRFDTAWAPPLPVVEKIVQTYPLLDVTLKYWEGGMQFKGTLRGKRGEIVKHEQSQYKGPRGG
jgi:hypothetical protein